MRLSVFLSESTAQLFIDLRKIYQHYFTPEQLTNESLASLANNSNSQLYVTMFNERHLGALKVTTSGDQALLSLLTIRDLTRRRGIAKNLIKEVEKVLKAQGISTLKMELEEIQKEEQEGLTLFMQACGYQLNKSTFSKAL